MNITFFFLTYFQLAVVTYRTNQIFQSVLLILRVDTGELTELTGHKI